MSHSMEIPKCGVLQRRSCLVLTAMAFEMSPLHASLTETLHTDEQFEQDEYHSTCSECVFWPVWLSMQDLALT